MTELTARPLTEEAFAPYGEVIDLRKAQTQDINYGLTTRYHDLASIDTLREGGRTLVNVFRSAPITLPHTVRVMERHPLGSQAFIPMNDRPFLVLVGKGIDRLEVESLQLFITDGEQGVNYHANTWHHYQMVLGQTSDFLVIDRGGPGNNLEEVQLTRGPVIEQSSL